MAHLFGAPAHLFGAPAHLFGAPAPPSDEVAKNWCYTQSGVVELNYIWTINNFSFFGQDQPGKKLTSSTFFAADDESKWRMELYPNGLNEVSRGLLSLYLVLVSTVKLEVRAKCAFSILNAKCEKKNTKELTEGTVVVQGGRIGYENFIVRAALLNKENGFLPKDKLNILCKVSAITDIVNISDNGNMIQFDVPEGKFSEDLGNLILNARFSDVTLAVGGREFQAHKVILAARSPVFAAMFEHEMEERKQNRVTITDIDHEVFEEMLRFMYTDKAPNLAKMTESLLAAADKYALEKLKAMCEAALWINVSIETAVESLIFADLHSANHLKAQTIDFINTHSTRVMGTVKWINLLATHPHLIEETFRAIATQ